MASRSPNSATADICSLAQALAAAWKEQHTEIYHEISGRDLATYVAYKVFCWREILDVATSAGSACKIARVQADRYAKSAKCSAEDFTAILVRDWASRHRVVLPDGMLPPEPNAVHAQSAADETALPDGMLPPEPNAVLAQSAADETALPSEPASGLGAAQPMWCLPVVCATQPLPQPLPQPPAACAPALPVCRVQLATLEQSAEEMFGFLKNFLSACMKSIPPCPGMSAKPAAEPAAEPELLKVLPAQPPPDNSAQ